MDEFDDLLGRRDTGRLSRARYRKALAVLVERNPWFVDGHDGRRYIIIDTADNFEEPHWEVSRSDRRSEREPVTRDWLRPILQKTALRICRGTFP